MHSFILMAVITVLWAIVGYSLAFAEGTPFIGDFRYAFLNGVGAAPNPDYAGTIPQQTFMIYQLMFAVITPALISGAYAERMKFSAMLLFTVLWALIVYFPMAHMVWGKGGLLNTYLGGRIACFDFAGGTVVHITFGAAAAALGWILIEWLRNGKAGVLGAISGAVAGLVAITPASSVIHGDYGQEKVRL